MSSARAITTGPNRLPALAEVDAAPYARLLQIELTERIPDARVFIDLDSIEAGLDFAEIIREAVDSCGVLVALIGQQWATVTDEQGQRPHERLTN